MWLNGEIVIDTRLDSAAPVTKYLRVPDGEEWVVVDTRVNRAIRPRDFGAPDNRELGLLVKWDFLAGPPPTVQRAGSH